MVQRAPSAFRDSVHHIVTHSKRIARCHCSACWWMYLRIRLHGQTKDPQVNLSQIIPLRLYGDGAESQRYLFDVCFLMQLSSHKIWTMARWRGILMIVDLTKENRNLKSSPFSSLAANLLPRCKIEFCPLTLMWGRSCMSKGGPIRIGRLIEPRCAIINTNYSRTLARSRVLELLAWSFNALGFLAGIIYG